MRVPIDSDAIGRGGATDRSWQTWSRDAVSLVVDTSGGMTLFHRLLGQPLVLQVSLSPGQIVANEGGLRFLPLLCLVPGIFVVALAFLGHRIRQLAYRIEASALAPNDERMQLLADMSHELRTPLSGIVMNAELLAEEHELSESQNTKLAHMIKAGTLMRAVIGRVIELARPEDRAENPTPVPCDLDALMHTSLDIVDALARRKGLHLHGIMNLGTPRYVMLAPDF